MCLKKIFYLFIAVLLCASFYLIYPEDEIRYEPGILVESEPDQTTIINAASWTRDEFTITPLAEFHLKARVLSYENYSLGKESKISPVDLALGWGPMSDQLNLDQIEIKQRNRWYYWKTKTIAAPQSIITGHSANMHIIPASPEIDDELNEIRRGSLIELTGYLVIVNTDEGWTWKSSLSRKDSGEGACELFWVNELKLIN
ncbi:MAG: hypothetical protein IPM56_14330 [Ignavibacteriales bacterium]|nr:MAG: hypothetical protein IPM56_14330 [Ignavibacteriales bacterium]